MIRVNQKPEPDSFNDLVRQKGLSFLQKKHIALTEPFPAKTKSGHYWRDCLDDLYSSYQGQCAYLAVFFERATGGGSVDHFIAKSKRADLAYEWNNYRLACSTLNSRKREYEDILDPFEVIDGWFHLELVTGRIFPDPGLSFEIITKIQATIIRLGLDDPGNREMRARHYQEYRERHYDAYYLKRRSPFVWYEAQRQGLL